MYNWRRTEIDILKLVNDWPPPPFKWLIRYNWQTPYVASCNITLNGQMNYMR